jgi:AcrR family transcriptional regulator
VLIEAAREMFVELGYHGASLRQIAIRANTTKAMLYHHFPSKAELFKESVFRPFAEFVAEFVAGWEATPVEKLSTPELVAGFTRALYEFTATHRGLMLALIAADAHGDDELADVKSSFRQTIANVVAQLKADRSARGWSEIDLDVVAPATMAMIISSALLEDWLFPIGPERPGKERFLRELAAYETRGVTVTGSPRRRTRSSAK